MPEAYNSQKNVDVCNLSQISVARAKYRSWLKNMFYGNVGDVVGVAVQGWLLILWVTFLGFISLERRSSSGIAMTKRSIYYCFNRGGTYRLTDENRQNLNG